MSISTTLDDIFEFIKKYYAVLPFYGLASQRILSLCEEYVLLQQSEQRKIMELPKIDELEERICDLI